MGEFASHDRAHAQGHSTFARSPQPEVVRTRSELASDAIHASARDVASLTHSIDAVHQATATNGVAAWKEARASLDRNLAAAEQSLERAQARAHDASSADQAELSACARSLDDARASASTLNEAPRGWKPLAREASILAVLQAPVVGTTKAGFEQKEQALRAELAQLDPAESAALAARLRKAQSGDPIAAEVARMIPERRARIQTFLADARRRAAVSTGRGLATSASQTTSVGSPVSGAARVPGLQLHGATTTKMHGALLGSEHTPASSGMVPDLHSLAPTAPRLIGNSTQVDAEHPTENESVNAGGPQEAGFLTKNQRDQLDRQNTYRLGVAGRNYALALKTLEIEQLIKKPDDLGFMMTLLLGVAESVLTSFGAAAIKALCKPGVAKTAIEDIDHAAVRAAKAAEKTAETATGAVVPTTESAVEKASKEAQSSIRTLTEVQLNLMVKTSLSKGKGAVSPSLNPATSKDSPDAAEKAQSESLIGLLKKQGDVAFDQLDQDISTVSDGMALTWWRALAPQDQSEEMYAAKMHETLRKYIASPVSKIGRSMDWEADGIGTAQHVEKEVRIVRVLVPGYGTRYAAKDSVFDGYLHDHPGTMERSGAYDAPSGALSLAEDATWNIGGKEQRRHETRLRPDKILNYIEPEFEELAKQKQEKTWQQPIETYKLTFAAGHPRLIKVAGA